MEHGIYQKMITYHKKNIIILLLLLCAISLYGIVYNANQDKKSAEHLIELGKNNPEFLKFHPEVGDENYTLDKTDSLNFAFRVLYSDPLKSFAYLIIFIIIFFSTRHFYNIIKTGMLKDMVLRESYWSVLNKQIYGSYIYSFIPIIFMIILILMSCVYHFDLDFLSTCKNEYLCYIPHLSIGFVLSLIYNLIVISLYYINVSIIMLKHSKNYVLNIITSFLVILGIELFMQCGIGPILASTTGDVGFGNLLSSANLWYYDSVSYLQTICYTTSSFLISFLIMKKQFKNKEKVYTLNAK